MISLPDAPQAYSAENEQRFRARVGAEIDKMRRSDGDVELAKGQRAILRSPNGARWALSVDNAGAVTAVAL